MTFKKTESKKKKKENRIQGVGKGGKRGGNEGERDKAHSLGVGKWHTQAPFTHSLL